ncbi:hypothetical protein MYCTH_40367 [Thermothelomyces thermophilus ATCC 42464]|uniref:2,5-diamino-6-ribosylamino-4(3H)-pyrimidinone 5'-phosphate reductase n=1 Tax=Thermothelomyces thermophilus (strain ATCC 42464 / BCRC 31852 / DSM 1799) TaxID=573729 RepID=G2Q3V4_THET4|nr:uncharacterized protein MYCTH_40367 [Thermothelomyces thermophilus ATCC 42464]AEO55257.1 hypothetical protein MYCTH_40367 [Thermothelomyces thermophilus ATCC 42464]
MSAPPSKQEQTLLTFPSSHAALINPYLPPLDREGDRGENDDEQEEEEEEARQHHGRAGKVHLTLTYAHSLDAALARAPGVRTVLSGPASKAMTHYLRARHDAILVGVGTAVADDPGLNSRLRGAAGLVRVGSQPRPVVLDPRGRWLVGAESKVVRLAAEGKGLGPWVFVGEGVVVDEGRRKLLERVGGGYVAVPLGRKGRFEWGDVLGVLGRKGIRSVMVEGGGEVINSLLARDGKAFVDSVIVTIAPTWLGQGDVVVSPPRMEGPAGEPPEQLRLTDVKWCPMGEDVVLCGRIAR